MDPKRNPEARNDTETRNEEPLPTPIGLRVSGQLRAFGFPSGMALPPTAPPAMLQEVA